MRTATRGSEGVIESVIERYTTPEMAVIWNEEAKFQRWLVVELAVCEAWARLGRIPDDAMRHIRTAARFDINRVLEIEKTTNHDVIAFCSSVAEFVGPESRFIHMGLTSSDIVDTAQALALKESGGILMKELEAFRDTLRGKAVEWRDCIMVGRTHGIHAEPTTFGLKCLLWMAELDRDIDRLQRAIETVSVGKFSGAVGTYSNIQPEMEEEVCSLLGLRPAPVSTQVVQRDRHAEYMGTLAVLGGSLEKIATEIRNLQRTDILEVEEYFSPGQKGSSAMPHKRNPVRAERVAGLARILRGNALAAFENQALWHERDITHSSVERVILADSCCLAHYMLVQLHAIIAKLIVYPDRMKANLERTDGLIFSQRVLLALVEKGLTRESAYEIVQSNAMETWKGNGGLKERIEADSRVAELLTRAEIEDCFDVKYFLRNLGAVYRRFDL